MTSDDVQMLFVLLERIVFLLQTLALTTSCLCGFVAVQLIIHTKNQKHLF